jgi:hypothetical protein
MFLIAFKDCLHTQIKDYKFVRHAGVRHVEIHNLDIIILNELSAND